MPSIGDWTRRAFKFDGQGGANVQDDTRFDFSLHQAQTGRSISGDRKSAGPLCPAPTPRHEAAWLTPKLRSTGAIAHVHVYDARHACMTPRQSPSNALHPSGWHENAGCPLANVYACWRAGAVYVFVCVAVTYKCVCL